MRTRNLARLLVGTAVAALTVVACGAGVQPPSVSVGGSPAATAEATVSMTPATIEFAVASTSVGPMPVYVGLARGLFKQQNLTVNVSNVGQQQAVVLLAGQTDLIYASPGVAVGLLLKGQRIVGVYGGSADLTPATELWSRKVKTVQEAQALTDCRLATTPPGSGLYASALYWQQKFGLKCEITAVQSVSLLVAGVQSGTYDLATIPRNQVGTVPSGVNVAIDTKDPNYRQLYSIPGSDKGPTSYYMGLPGNLGSKRDAMVRFERVLIQAQSLVAKATVDELVADLQQAADWFRATPADSLRQQIPLGLASAWKDPSSGKAGFISKEAWSAMLGFLAYYGLDGFDAKNPALSYENAADMSYFTAAEKN